MLELRLEIEGDKELNKGMGIVVDAVSDLRPAFVEIGRLFEKFQRGVFLGKGKGGSVRFFDATAEGNFKPWVKLKDRTIKEKQRLGFGKWATYPLIRTGKLMNAFTSRHAGNGAVRDYGKLTMAWGVEDDEIPYAKIHHTGAKLKHGRIPVRKPFRLPKNLRKMVFRVIGRHLSKTGQFERGAFGRRS